MQKFYSLKIKLLNMTKGITFTYYVADISVSPTITKVPIVYADQWNALAMPLCYSNN